MNSPRNRLPMLLATLGMALLISAFWSVQWMNAQYAAARAASEDLILSQALAAAITDMRSQTAVISGRASESNDMGSRVDSAAGAAGIPASVIEGIYPQPAQRVGSLPFADQATSIALRKVELRPLATFLRQLANHPGATVRQIRLRAPNGDAPTLQWDADITLSTLIYAPPERGGGQ